MNSPLTANVRSRKDQIYVIDVQGDLIAQSEDTLMAAYNTASQSGAKAIIVNFEGLDYMNSSGIGLLVTLLIRVQRQKQRLLAFGLTDHYQQIFALTRLNEAIGIFESEDAAVTAVAAPA